ncbi:MAG: right-handed parallel beta-helix repeat-containing protein [Bacteroidetes bacterium]|nr:right-handed parallel beta-helix repeat-containing protein [Bacteroidota bacterium]
MVKPSIIYIFKLYVSLYPGIARVGVALLLILTTLHSFSQISYLGGVMENSRTLYSDTTYVIYQNYEVLNGKVLKINAGVVVKINYGMGLIVDEGILKVDGSESDSVKFLPNHSNPGQMWKWSGLTIRNANAENQSYIKYANIIDAETAILLEDSKSVEIENSSMLHSQNLGIQVINSSYCLFINCVIEHNYDGIELSSDFLRSTSDNVIYNCKIKNENHNIKIQREVGGLYQNNLISHNIIESGNNGIWINNYGGSVNSKNVIEKNIIMNNRSDAGYGLYLAHDSTIVSNNIFWNNSIAIFCEEKGNNCLINNNSFYQNSWAIAIGAGSEGNKHLNNTFSLNSTELLGIKETGNTVFSQNNLLNNYGQKNIVVNNTGFDLSIANNYWGTTDTATINRLIYDYKDNPDRGVIYYDPYLSKIDTTNPVSPPYNVKKQLVDNKTMLSWNANKEEDLRGYKLYYGNFSDYSFSISQELQTDTMFLLSGDISIFDPIAVTAFDNATLSSNSQLSGHESPFAFAILYPYAGMDTIICKYTQELELIQSSIPYPYEQTLWTTSGDGYFINPDVLKTSYFPGVIDIMEGGAIISLKVSTNNDTLIDSFILSIIDNPIAFAGNDTIVVADSPVELVSSYALNYEEVRWFSNGDGNFNSDTLINPIYYPGIADINFGEVYLDMIAFSECGTVSDSVKITIEPHFSIEGKLWTNQKSPYTGTVIAFMKNPSGARAAQIEFTESDGYFRFDKVMRGNYYIYALPDTNNQDNVVPGYYANKVTWEAAYLLPVDADVYDIDIYLPSVGFVLPVGEASITGHMVTPSDSKYNSEIYCAPWFQNSGSQFCNGGLSNITVFLYNSNKTALLDYTLTDEFGDFYLTNLPYGNYMLEAEKAGYFSSASSLIVVSPDHKNETGVILEIYNQKIGITTETNIDAESIIDVYPNPAIDEINIPYYSHESTSEIYISNVFGHIVLKQIVSDQDGAVINIQHLVSGIYFGRVIMPNITLRFSFIVR